MQLLSLFLALILPGPILTLAERLVPELQLPPHLKARIGVSLFFGITSSGHFLQTAAMTEMLPPVVPFRRAVIYGTGVLEALGSAGLWVPRLERVTGMCLLVMLVGLLPVNVYAAFKRVAFGGHGRGPGYLVVRIPFQVFVMWRIYRASIERQDDTPRRVD